MSKFYKIRYVLLIILIIGVFAMPNFFKGITRNIIDQIKYRETYVTGEITVNNGDGTYDVKINNASTAYKNVETRHYNEDFSVGQIVDIGYEYGNKESPKILGPSKKIPQEPKQVEVDYSGGCAGVQIKTVIIYAADPSGYINVRDEVYATAHNSVDGADCLTVDVGTDYLCTGQNKLDSDPDGCYAITKGYLYLDLSSIPDDANIISAVLTLTIGDNYLVDFYIIVQDGQPNNPHDTLEAADFNRTKYSNNGGQVAAEAAPATIEITLNSNGRAWLRPGEMTKLCLRSSLDISSSIPGPNTGHSVLIVKSSTTPKLTITYEI